MITSTAVIMIAVCGVFRLATVVLIKAVGLGIAVDVALDATPVRRLLLPAALRLFEHANDARSRSRVDVVSTE